jgi:hypothetical protein
MAGFDWTNVAFGFVADPVPINAMGLYVDRMSKRVVGWGQRATPSSFTSTEVGALRIDNLIIKAGEIYRFWTSPLLFRADTAGGNPVANLRISTSGVATTSSTTLTQAFDIVGTTPANANFMTKGINFIYQSASDQIASLLLSVARFSGTGQVVINAGASIPIQLVAEWIGADPGNTGVAL